tara:strand:+ start:133 stop:366 length:234 start_codon:yes stop_codon:yes gene_type:complete
MKYKRIKKKIVKFLEENGEKSTMEIYAHINRIDKNGITTSALCNVLAKTPYFEKVETRKVSSITLSTYDTKIWRMKK